jgi:hypothetical protein
MAKVITFSRQFPSYHPKAGEPTYFVEKMFKSLFLMKCIPVELYADFNFSIMNNDNYAPKHHTVRNGSRWKVGDKFSPRVWSGKPYHSKQIILSEDIEIKRIWDIEIDEDYAITINGWVFSCGYELQLAKNDGLPHEDFLNWFVKLPFKGQIICWNDSVTY